MQAPLIPSGSSIVQRALTISAIVHAVFVLAVALFHEPDRRPRTELVDIEMAPPPPPVEALPPEVARPPEETLAAIEDKVDPAASTPPPLPPGEGYAVDAGVDAMIDAMIDAPIDAPPPDARPRRPDAGIDAAPPDAAEPLVAVADGGVGEDDAGVDDAQVIAELGDAGATGEATITGSGGEGVAAVGSGSGDGSAKEPGSIAMEAGSGSGSAGQTDEPAVDGAPTTAGTAANLLTYFPRGHIITALIRFDRLRGTEWAAQTERLLQPMPDYRVLFGTASADVANKLDTLVISTPSPRDAAATTLVGRTRLPRAQLRELLQTGAPVTWSTAKGGLLGKRAKLMRGDERVFLSPYLGCFLLAQPADLAGLTSPAPGALDTATAKGKLPAWIASVNKIERESGEEARGPALVVTIALDGKRFELGENDFGTGIKSVPTPDRISLAMELVKQGWLVRGNMRFGSEKEATELIAALERMKQLVADSRAIQTVLGKPIARVIANLSFARTGGRVSYATSISIADAREILSVLATQLDGYFAGRP